MTLRLKVIVSTKTPPCPTLVYALRGGLSGSRTHDPPVESHRLNQDATMSHTCICAAVVFRERDVETPDQQSFL